MKVFTANEINLLEKCSVDSGESLFSLMEKAGGALALVASKHGKNILILCGKGNNGGDGFIAADRFLKMGIKTTVVLAQRTVSTDIANYAFDQIKNKVDVYSWKNNQRINVEKALENCDVILDCVFGIGFKGEFDEEMEELMILANKSKAVKISADIPSGLHCDTGRTAQNAFKADYTVAFTALKPCNIIEPGKSLCGKNIIASVVDKKLQAQLPASFSVIEEREIISNFKKRDPQSHKGTYGTVLMVCGSYGMVGAAVMAAKAALRTGVGLVNMVVSKECYPIIASALPQAVFTIMDFSTQETTASSSEKLFEAINKASACVIGPGLGEDAVRYVPLVIKFSPCPVVVDADALNYLAKNMSILDQAKSEIVVTPHPAEMARLTGKTAVQIQLDRISLAKRFSVEHKLYTVLKGSGTVISSPQGEVKMNTTGNAGMAKGGSGDVLAGMIGALIAQGFSVGAASETAVFAHGKVGDYCAEKLSQISMLPTDIIDNLSVYFKEIEGKLV